MCHKHRGKAIIFNHERYDENLSLKVRQGTKADRERLEKTLQNLGFVVRVYDDLPKKVILEKLIREQQNNYHYNSDCLVVVVLTHGGEKGRLYAKDTFYTVSELWAPFMADNFGVNTTKVTTDSIKMLDESAGATFTIPNEADILVAYSTYEGRVAYRDTDDGTWYISELCKEMDQSAKSDDLLTMLTRVNRQVALTKENFQEKQMPSLQSTLTRKIYFFTDDRHKQSISNSSLQEIHSKLDRLLNASESGLASPSSLPISDTLESA
ncbi:Caspase-1, partial [Gryllus bimaculatus]